MINDYGYSDSGGQKFAIHLKERCEEQDLLPP